MFQLDVADSGRASKKSSLPSYSATSMTASPAFTAALGWSSETDAPSITTATNSSGVARAEGNDGRPTSSGTDLHPGSHARFCFRTFVYYANVHSPEAVLVALVLRSC